MNFDPAFPPYETGGPSEAPLNIKFLSRMKDLLATILSIADEAEQVDTGDYLGAVTLFGEESPDNAVGKNGDFFFQEDPDLTVWVKKADEWQVVASEN